MAVLAFFSRFEELAFVETRSCAVLSGQDVPPDDYGFLEFFCDDAHCDCQRVIIRVIGQRSAEKIWATISFGWESVAFYEKWMRRKLKDPGEFSRPSLDPLNPQSAQAAFFLTLFEELVRDKAYVARIKRHYEMFRAPDAQLNSWN